MALHRKVVISICLVCLAGLLTVYGGLPLLRARSVAHPPRSALSHFPAEYRLEAEDVSFTTIDGLTLQGWYVPSQNGALVIITHGYGSNRSGFLEQAAFLSRYGYGVLLFDLIAHGESDGSLLSLDGRDVLAAVQYVRNREGVQPDRIGLWGFSLGGLVSLQAAAQEPSIQAVIADGPFPVIAMKDMPAPETPVDWFWIHFDLVQYQALKLQGVSGAMSTTQALERIAPRPILLIAGTQNRGEQRVLRKYAAAAGQATTLWEVAEAGHLGSWNARTDEYKSKALAFFDRALLEASDAISVDRSDPESVLRAYFEAWNRNDWSLRASLMDEHYGFMTPEFVESVRLLELNLISDSSSSVRTYQVTFEIMVKNIVSMNSGRYDWTYTLTWDAKRGSWLITNYGAG